MEKKDRGDEWGRKCVGRMEGRRRKAYIGELPGEEGRITIKVVKGFLRTFIIFILGGLTCAGVFYAVVSILRDVEPFGYRLNYSLKKIERSKYLDKIDNFSFVFSKEFEIDASTESAKRYGKDYLVGFKDKNDPRIGCEVRKRSQKLDLNLSDDEIKRDLVLQFGKDADKFKVTRAEKVTLEKGLPAFQFNFSFLDPLAATAAINEVLIPKGNDTYLLMCGAGKSYFDKFTPDFALFFNSFKFEGK